MGTLANRLRKALEESGLSQPQLAKLAKMTQGAIGGILSGKTKRTTRIFELADALDVNPRWLALGTEPMRPSDREFWKLIGGGGTAVPPFPAASLKAVVTTTNKKKVRHSASG